MTDKKPIGSKIKNSIKSLTEGAVFLIDNIERLAIVIVSRIAPWAAPLAPAYLVARATVDHFGAPPAVAIAVAVTVEAVGIAATHITMEMYQYNQTKRKSDPAAPFSVGLAASISYFFIGITLTVLLEMVPKLTSIAPGAFFLLAVVAYITLALMSGHARRLEAISQAKTEKAEQRKRNKSGTETEIVPEGLPEFGSIEDGLNYYDARNVRKWDFAQWQQLRELVWLRDGKKCVDCGEKIVLTDETHCHHIVPDAKGGPGRPTNLISLCRFCHEARHGKDGTVGTTRDQAHAIFSANPNISGSELGRMLGKSASLGRRFKRELETELPENGNEPAPEQIEVG